MTKADTNDYIDAATRRRYDAAGFGRSSGLGSRPALLVIDVQYRTVGTVPKPFDEAISEFPTACGEEGWRAIPNIEKLIDMFRVKSWPILYPHVAPKTSNDHGRLEGKVPAIMGVASKGYEFVAEVAPHDGDILIPKKHPSAFFGTPLISHLIDLDVDTILAVGCTTSGCIRASVVDAFSFNFHTLVPNDACYDRAAVVHEVNLFDIGQKYADVAPTEALLTRLSALPEASTGVPA